jgi:glycosyltransferase involved in cell wall biosynthesis
MKKNKIINEVKSKIAILLCTYQGDKYLKDQLDSFLLQKFTGWNLFVSDDGSTDETIGLIKDFKRKIHDKGVLYLGPQNGFASHFFSLTQHPDVKADFYAWSDQDDIWRSNKLSRVSKWLKNQPNNVPILYCSRTCIVDKKNKIVGFSPQFLRPPTFKNALVQNIAGGNTMVFNNKAKELFLKIESELKIVSHDWAMYQIVTACGGKVFYDSMPLVRYRQHDQNLIGQNTSLNARLKRLMMVLNGSFYRWNNQNINILKKLEGDMTIENLKTFQEWVYLRNCSPFRRLYLLKKLGIYRQTLMGQIMLYFSIFIGKA